MCGVYIINVVYLQPNILLSYFRHGKISSFVRRVQDENNANEEGLGYLQDVSD